MNAISRYAKNIVSFDWKKEAKENLIPSAAGLFMGAVAGPLTPLSHAGFAASYIARRAFNTFVTPPLKYGNEHLIKKIHQYYPSTTKALLAEWNICNFTLNFVAPLFVGYQASQALGYDISIPGLLFRSLLAGYVFDIVKGRIQDDPFKNSDVISIDGSNFQKEVLESELPVLVDVYGSRCPPCRMMAPIFSELSKELEGRVKCVKLNTSSDLNLTKNLNIVSIPTFLFYKDGKILETVEGAVPKAELNNKISTIFFNNQI